MGDGAGGCQRPFCGKHQVSAGWENPQPGRSARLRPRKPDPCLQYPRLGGRRCDRDRRRSRHGGLPGKCAWIRRTPGKYHSQQRFCKKSSSRRGRQDRGFKGKKPGWRLYFERVDHRVKPGPQDRLGPVGRQAGRA